MEVCLSETQEIQVWKQTQTLRSGLYFLQEKPLGLEYALASLTWPKIDIKRLCSSLSSE